MESARTSVCFRGRALERPRGARWAGWGQGRSEQDTQTPVMGRRGCFLLGAGRAV